MPELVYAVVTDAPVNIAELSKLVTNPQSGAVVTFCGDVRNHDGGKEVASLLYEIHPSAPEQIKLITESAMGRFEIEKVAVARPDRNGAIGAALVLQGRVARQKHIVARQRNAGEERVGIVAHGHVAKAPTPSHR